MSDHSWKNKIDEMKNRTIDIHKANAELESLLDKYDWFYTSVVEDRSICVYVVSMVPETSIIPDFLYGHHVKVGFASYLTCGDKYSKKPSSSIIDELEFTE